MRKLAFLLLGLIIGYVIGDYLAFWFAEKHGTPKYGGLFSRQPKAGALASDKSMSDAEKELVKTLNTIANSPKPADWKPLQGPNRP